MTDTTVPVNDAVVPVNDAAVPKNDAAVPKNDAVVEGVDVDALHDAVLAYPGIAGIGSSLPGALATYLPGRRVMGIRVTADVIELEVRTRADAAALHVGAGLQADLKQQAAGRRIDVTIVDIELPESETR